MSTGPVDLAEPIPLHSLSTRTPCPAATLRVCADGGANRLYDELPAMLLGQSADAVRSAYLPTAIQGDMDSIRPDVLDFYRQRGVPVHDLSGGCFPGCPFLEGWKRRRRLK